MKMLNRTRFSFVMIATAALLPGLASAIAFSDDARKADLLGVYQAALQNDPQLSAARHADNQPVKVEAMLENKEIGFGHPHQKVTVTVETFTFTKYGAVPGEVLSVSDDTIDNERKGSYIALELA